MPAAGGETAYLTDARPQALLQARIVRKMHYKHHPLLSITVCQYSASHISTLLLLHRSKPSTHQI